MAVIAFHVRSICSFHFHASPSGKTIEGDLVNDTFGVGDHGVKLFFAISGFILALPFARQYLCHGNRVSLREYYVRRLSRIQPPYVIHLVFLFLACWLVLRWQPSHPHLYKNAAWAGYALKHILASLFYVNGFLFATHPYPNIVLWALEIEVQFYILAPFLARIFMVASAWKRRMLIVILILAGSWLDNSTVAGFYRIAFSLAGTLPYFLVGFLLAGFYLLNKVETAIRSYKWDPVFPLAVAAVVLLRHQQLMTFLLPWVILFCCLAALLGVITAKALGNSWITTIGGMCYTIYMYHWLMISLLVRLTGRWQTHILWLDLLIQFIVMSVIIIVLCAVLFALFERPFMRRNWPSICWSRLKSAKKAAAAQGRLPPG